MLLPATYLRLRARIRDFAIDVAAMWSFETLHQARIIEAIICSLDSYTTTALLHDDGENKAVIE